MHTKRSRSSRLTRSAALLSALALVGFGPTGLAYADKPSSPPGQAKQSSSSQPAKAKPSPAEDHRTSGTAGTSGEATSPQPRSKADSNGTGANKPGPYDSTRDGSPSLNGNGGGKATGKPCAGCVGKADNKNPKGQYPNGSDHNQGYECDGNNGIGKTNPAHTGCTTTPPPEPPKEPENPCVDNPGTPKDECGEVTPPEEPENPCVDVPGTPEDECGEVTPPEEPEGPCVDNPGTPEDECGQVAPPEEPEVPCVDSPATPEDECGQVAPPGGTHNPPGAEAAPKLPGQTVSAVPPGNEVAQAAPALPATGAASGSLLTALAGLLLLAAGAWVTRLQRIRVRA